VSLSHTDTEALAVAEVALWELPTLGKEILLRKQYTTQSSTYFNNATNQTQPANQSVDGDYYNSTTYVQDCSSTNVETRPWWRVFLEKTKKVSQVRIYNDAVSGAGNQDIKVSVGNAWDHNLNDVCSNYQYFDNATLIIADCNLEGKFINVFVDSDNQTALNICEV
jgi:hypothetical protein